MRGPTCTRSERCWPSGTSTAAGDPVEIGAIRQLVGGRADEVLVSSTKSMHGHGMGAAGGFEAVLTALRPGQPDGGHAGKGGS